MGFGCGTGHSRHWFRDYGAVGRPRPDCVRCGAPNPRPLTPEERADFEYAVSMGWAKPEGRG